MKRRQFILSIDKNLGNIPGCGYKYDSSYIIETLNPFSSFISLTSNIKHVKFYLVDSKFGLKDTRCEDTSSQNVLLCRLKIFLIFDDIHLVQEIFGTVYQLVLVGPIKACLYPRILP